MVDVTYSSLYGAISAKDALFGATGDGTTDDTAAIQACFNAAFGTTASPNGNAGRFGNKIVFFPPGNYKITSPLTIRSLTGGKIIGSGSNSTRISSSGSVIETNGFSYSSIEGINLAASGSGVCLELDWDNTGSVALNANRFQDILFEGEGKGNGTIGCRVGLSGNMGSENLFLNCHFNGHTTGFITSNANALSQKIIGGGAAQCSKGIWMQVGSIPLVQDAGFAENDRDIVCDQQHFMTIMSCRTESPIFLDGPAGTYAIISCTMASYAGTDPTYFIKQMNGECIMINCSSSDTETVLDGNHGPLALFGCNFSEAAIANYGGPLAAHRQRIVRQSKTSNYTIKRIQSGVSYDNDGASGTVVFTLPGMQDESSGKGTSFSFYVAAAQTLQITATGGMTIRVEGDVTSANGNLTCSTVGSFITLECLDGEGSGSYGTRWVATNKMGTWTVSA